MVDEPRAAGAPGATVRVACVTADTVRREGLALLVRTVRVVVAVDSVAELLRRRPEADVVLLDLPPGGGADVRAAVAAGYRVVLHTAEPRLEVLAACLALGARAVVGTAAPVAVLERAVTEVAAGRATAAGAPAGLAEVVQAHRDRPVLSARQQEVLSARARGESYRSIAERLFISRKTAEGHMELVVAKHAGYLRDHSPADLEHRLGTGPGDVLDRARG